MGEWNKNSNKIMGWKHRDFQRAQNTHRLAIPCKMNDNQGECIKDAKCEWITIQGNVRCALNCGGEMASKNHCDRLLPCKWDGESGTCNFVGKYGGCEGKDTQWKCGRKKWCVWDETDGECRKQLVNLPHSSTGGGGSSHDHEVAGTGIDGKA